MRALLLGLAGFVAGVLLGLQWREDGVPGRAKGNHGRVRGGPEGPSPRRRPDAVPHATQESPAEQPTEAPDTEPAAVEAWIDVNLRVPEAWLHDGYVYALPASSRGVDDPSLVAHVTLDGEAAVRIPVALPGCYDIGCAGPMGSAMTTDVLVSSGAARAVDVIAPATAPVTFVWAGGARPPSWHARALVVGASGRAGIFLPGRGEPPSIQVDLTLSGTAIMTAPLLAGVPLDVRAWLGPVDAQAPRPDTAVDPDHPAFVPGFGVRVDRDRAQAGDTVTVSASPLGRLLVHLRTESAPGGGGRLAAGVRLDGESPNERWIWVGRGQDGRPVYSKDQNTFSPNCSVALVGNAGPARLEWRGTGWRAGSLDLLLPAEGTIERVVTLVADEEARARLAQTPEEHAEVRLPLTFPGADEEMICTIDLLGITRDGEGAPEVWVQSFGEVDGATVTLDEQASRVKTLLAVQSPSRASRPVPFEHRRAIEVRLEPAGWLLVHPEVVFPAALGRLTLQRSDELPLVTMRWEEGELSMESPEPVVAVGPGTLVGPLPSGHCRFTVRLGGVRLRDAEATVRPGALELLPIRK